MIIDLYCHLNSLNFDDGLTIKQIINDDEKRALKNNTLFD